MYLEKLHIKNFRSIKNLDLQFNKGLNIIIGENNSGKSAIIDALRICLGVAKQWKDIGVRNDDDFYLNVEEINDQLDPIEFHLYFKVEIPLDRQKFNSLVVQHEDPQQQSLQMHFRYYLEDSLTGSKTLRYKSWGGETEDNPIKSEEAQLIYFSYLAALRNAEQELKPYAKENKVISLFREMSQYEVEDGHGGKVKKELTHDAKKELAKKLESVIKDKDWDGLIKSGEELVNEHLEKADISKKEAKIHLRLLEYEFNNIIKGLLIRKPVYNNLLLGNDFSKQKYFDLSQNGLGENNLIYASAVLGDLKNRRAEQKEHYYALLIEEPEAHLHPQRQNTFFSYLNNLKELDVQIFITSHSPTLTSKADLNNLLILQKQDSVLSAFRFNTSELSDINKSYLRKFLDVTKSQLFFSSGSILVEGISEALLLPVIAKIIGNEYDLEKNGVELVNINGVAFEPFAKLFNSNDGLKRLPSRCSLITDNDKSLVAPINFINNVTGINKDIAKGIFKQLQFVEIINRDNRIVNYHVGVALNLGAFEPYELSIRTILDAKFDKISNRALNAEKLSGNNLKSFLGEITFEYELLIQSEFNYKIIKAIYRSMHPRTDFLITGGLESRALDLLEKIAGNKDKSVLAETLANVLDTRNSIRKSFIVPAYLREAIIWVIDGND